MGKPVFEIASIEPVTAVVINQSALTMLHEELEKVRNSGTTDLKPIQGFRTILKNRLKDNEPATVLVMPDKVAMAFVSVLEEAVIHGVTLERPVYALGEQLSYRLQPDHYFGVRRQAA